MKTLSVALIVMVLILSSVALPLPAQLVADGATATINGTTTNIIGNLTVGTNGSFATLVITNVGIVTNSGNGTIGQNSAAQTNRVIVTGANSAWNMGGNLVFAGGSYNQLIVTNGGSVANGFATIATTVVSSGNSVLVTGENSVWTNRENLTIGQLGPSNRVVVTGGGTIGSGFVTYVGFSSVSNQLTVANGGKAISGSARLGYNFGSQGNVAVISDAGSEWRLGGELNLGVSGDFNQLFLTNGAKIFSAGAYVGDQTPGGGTGSSNLVMIAGAGSTWTNSSTTKIGFNGWRNQLVITNGGQMINQASDGTLTLGSQISGSNNVLIVTGTNSLFSNLGSSTRQMVVGLTGSTNQLLISNGGTAETRDGFLGYGSASSNNAATITGAGSLWRNGLTLNVGYSGAGNLLSVTAGGAVYSTYGSLGLSSTSSNNVAIVTGSGSVWSNAFELYVGEAGGGNQLIVSNSGSVFASDLVVVGFQSGSAGNRVLVDGGTLRVTNATSTGVLDIQRGTNVLNAGMVTVDRLLLTNLAGTFEFKSGTLSVGSSTVSNGRPFLVGTGIGATLHLLGDGLHSFNDGLVITNGLLQGSGTIVGPVTVNSGGWIALQSTSATDRLILSNTPFLGDLVGLDVSKQTGVRTNDQILCASNLVYGGRLFIEKLGDDALTAGDRFQLFRAPGYSGAFILTSLPPLSPGLKWSNNLLVDGSIEVVPGSPPVLASIAQVGTNLVFSVTNGNPSYAYDLRATTNVTLPWSNWTTVATGGLDWLGNATITNGINPAISMRFFRLFQYPD